jgi:hypothetical protein
MNFKNAVNLDASASKHVCSGPDLSKYVCYKYENGKCVCYKYENGKYVEHSVAEKTDDEILQEKINDYCNAIQTIINNSKKYKKQYDELHGEGAYDRIYFLPENNFDDFNEDESENNNEFNDDEFEEICSDYDN